MRSILQTAFLAAATISTAMAAFDPTTNTDGQDPNASTEGLKLNTPTDLGCYNNPGKMYDMGIYTFQSSGWCQALCVRQAKQYFANVNGTNCFCGDNPPDSKWKQDNDNQCNTPCRGIDTATCGGTNMWEVYNSGYINGDPTGSQSITVPKPTYTFMGPGSSVTATSSTTTGPATVVVTQESTATPTQTASTGGASSSGPNTAAIAAGVVVAIVAVAAIAGGIFFYMRRKKQQAFAEEQRRHEMMTNFVTAEKPGSSYTSPDSRLDPSLMFQRRLSDGSIRDNEDYSRRILKVANPDA